MTSPAIANPTETVAPQGTKRYRLAACSLSTGEVLEWIKAHPGGTPRQMCKQKQDFANKVAYMILFGEVLRQYRGRIRHEWRVIGDGKGYPCQQGHYTWID
jgi:hypothetical protein